jgi:sugar O-acyltransferase (sialic acid O-acetyltransferase NeuD family)
VISTLEEAGSATVVGVVDDRIATGGMVAGYPVIGDVSALGHVARQSGASAFVVAIGDNAVRRALTHRLAQECRELTLLTVVHPTAWVAHDAVVGDGSIILAGAIIANGCRLGRGVLLGSRSALDHDCDVGDFASLAPGVTTGGTVQIGMATALGVGANVVHSVSIGRDSVVGAGALVLHDIPDEVVAYGVPCRVARSRAPGLPYL